MSVEAARLLAEDVAARFRARNELWEQTMAMFLSIMEEKDITQRELALRLGVTEGRVSHILRGTDRTKNTTLRMLADIAYALGVELEVRPK